MTQGKTAMWYDAASAAGSLEASDCPVKGKIGYVPPVEKTKSSGWLYTWAWGSRRPPQLRQGLEVHLLGLRRAVRTAGRGHDRLVQRAGRQARLHLHERRVHQGGRRPSRR